MGRSPCCDEKLGLKKGPWTPDEDQKLVSHIRQHGHGSWRALPERAGLKRCGKSCRLRWTNYLRPDIKRGRFSFEEDRIIVQLHAILGNRWSAIASHLPRRTDNEIKNYWNTHLKKRLTQMGIDPITHQNFTTSQLAGSIPPPAEQLSPPWTPLLSTQVTHMTQWDLALAEAEARLTRHTNPFFKPFTTPPKSITMPASAHPSAFSMPSWKTEADDTHKAKLRPVKLEPQFSVLHNWSGTPSLLQNNPAMADTVLGAALSSCVSGFVTEEEDSEIFVPSDRLYSLSGEGRSDNIYLGSVLGHLQEKSITESPSSILLGPDSEVTSPCGSTTSDCFDLIQHQSSSCFQSFPTIAENADQGPSGILDGTFWQRQQAALVEAMLPDSVLRDAVGGGTGGLELVVPLDFDNAQFPQFEILHQGEQYQADCVLGS